jgi:hypothetical protein
MLGQHRDDDIARVEQGGFLFVRRDLDEAKSSEQENSFNSQQCVTDFMHMVSFSTMLVLLVRDYRGRALAHALP